MYFSFARFVALQSHVVNYHSDMFSAEDIFFFFILV